MRTALFLTVIGLFSLNMFFNHSDFEPDKLAAIAKSVETYQGIVQVDKEKQFNQAKIVQIINRFNPNMPVNMKHEIADEINEMSLKYPNLDVDLICATITHESGRSWESDALSNAGAMGLMQIMPSTGKWLAKYENIPWTTAEEILYNPVYNIRLGCRYLSALIDTYDLEGGLAAYNGGAKRAKLWLDSNKAQGILWAETSDYIPFVLKLYDEYKSFTL